MVGYEALLGLNIFDMDDVFLITANKKTASSLVMRLIKKGLVKKIRNDLYCCVNINDKNVMASKYQIACALRSGAYISHYSALEYAKIVKNTFGDVYVSCDNRFTDFEFRGDKYNYVESKFQKGVVVSKQNKEIRTTCIERTVVDCIKRFDKMGGLEVLLNSLSGIPYSDDGRIIEFLDEYSQKFLYQKAGFILEQYKNSLRLSKGFFDYCKSKTGSSTRYLTKDSDTYVSEWKLVVPSRAIL